MHETVNATIDRVLRARDAAAVRIDTRLDRNVTGLRSPVQAETLGWPVLLADELTDEALSVALDESLTEAARARARRCRDHAIERLQDVHKRLVTAARELRD